MADTPALGGLSGDILAAHYQWLLEHAAPGPSGILCCKRTGQPLLSRVAHRYRTDAAGTQAPFVSEALLPSTTWSGRMISFIVFLGCGNCNERLPVPDSVFRCDIVSLNRGRVEP